MTEERIYILYKDILALVKPEMSIKDITKSTSKGNGKNYNEDWICVLLHEMERLNLIKKVIDEPKCVRYARTQRGEHLLKAESVDKIKR